MSRKVLDTCLKKTACNNQILNKAQLHMCLKTLMKMNTGRDDFAIEFDVDVLTMTLPEEMAYDQNWAFTKFSLVTTLRENVGVAKVIFREVHEPRQIEEE